MIKVKCQWDVSYCKAVSNHLVVNEDTGASAEWRDDDPVCTTAKSAVWVSMQHLASWPTFPLSQHLFLSSLTFTNLCLFLLVDFFWKGFAWRAPKTWWVHVWGVAESCWFSFSNYTLQKYCWLNQCYSHFGGKFSYTVEKSVVLQWSGFCKFVGR